MPFMDELFRKLVITRSFSSLFMLCGVLFYIWSIWAVTLLCFYLMFLLPREIPKRVSYFAQHWFVDTSTCVELLSSCFWRLVDFLASCSAADWFNSNSVASFQYLFVFHLEITNAIVAEVINMSHNPGYIIFFGTGEELDLEKSSQDLQKTSQARFLFDLSTDKIIFGL